MLSKIFSASLRASISSWRFFCALLEALGRVDALRLELFKLFERLLVHRLGILEIILEFDQVRSLFLDFGLHILFLRLLFIDVGLVAVLVLLELLNCSILCTARLFNCPREIALDDLQEADDSFGGAPKGVMKGYLYKMRAV